MFYKHNSLILLCVILFALSGCGGGGGGGGTPAATAPPAAETTQPAAEPAPEAADLNLKEAAPAVLQESGGAVAFSVPVGAPAAGASGGPSINAYYSPANAFDGKAGTWWAGQQNAGAWDIYYGLPEAVSLETLYINFYNSSYAPASVALKTSADGTTWTDVETKTARESKPLFTIASPQPVKYIHIAMSGDPIIGFPLIRDIDWTPVTYNTGPYATPAANDDYYFAENALDGTDGTWWAGQVDAAQWNFYYNFDTPQYIGLFTANLFNLNYRPQNMKLYTSEDGQAWTEIGELTAGDSPGIFVGQTVSYWLLQMSGNPPSRFPLIKDITYTLPHGPSSGDSINAFYKPANAFDNNPDTWWTGKEHQAEWNLFYGFADPTASGLITISYYADTHAPQSTELLISNDGQSWTSAGVFPAGASTSLWAGDSTKYLRFKMTGAPTVGYPLIKDINLNNSGAGAPVVSVVDAEGETVAAITEGDTIGLGLTGLTPGDMYDILVSLPDGTRYTLNLSADHNGTIPSSAVLVYDAGLEIDPAELGGGSPRAIGRTAALSAGESITVTVTHPSSGQTVSSFTLPYSGGSTGPSAYAANSGGYFRNGFVCGNNEDIYVAFRQFTAGETVRVYVAEERQAWKLGDYIPDVSGGFEEFTLPTSNFLFGPQYIVWKNSGGDCAPIGSYDIIVERGTLDGFINYEDIVDGHKTVGFVVQAAPSANHIIENLSSDVNYHYKSSFDPTESVYLYMNPKVRSLIHEQWTGGNIINVKKYVVNHQASWNAGDSILDATQGIEGDVVQWGCRNESLVTVWPAPLTPGCYDIIVDADLDGIYTPGVDYLDNIDDSGQMNCGFTVQSGGGACAAQCVDNGDCEDGSDDTMDTCDLAGTCNAYCRNDTVYCDLQVDKVNYVPGEMMQITFTGRNDTAQDVTCGAENALKNDKGSPLWNSYDENMYIVIPAGTQVTRIMTKQIPGGWAGTDTNVGADHDIYTVREDGTKWSKGDNYNIHVKWNCTVACFSDVDCDDGDSVPDYCNYANTCAAACSNTQCSPQCSNDMDCDDGDGATADTCDNMGTCNAVCSHQAICSVACRGDADCADGDIMTYDACANPNTCSAACVNTPCPVACSMDAHCDDGSALTTDTCADAGLCTSACTNTPCATACSLNSNCDDGNPATTDECRFSGTCSASCVSCTPACALDTDCDDGIPSTKDICMLPGTCFASCGIEPDSVKLSAGAAFTCAVTTAGGVKCWGRNMHGELGPAAVGDSSVPVGVPGLSDVRAVTTGNFHACALLNGGTVKCWGSNDSGQLGDGTSTSSSTPVSVAGLSGVLAVDAGISHTCALIADGTVQCWGMNNRGQLGRGFVTASGLNPEPVSGISTARVLSAGYYYNCVLLQDSSVQCWGDNAQGQLGNGTTTSTTTPVAVSGVAGAVYVSAGSKHTCAVLVAGGIKCWGWGARGELGNDDYMNSAWPVNVYGMAAGMAVAAGYDHTCALLSNGTAQCWGDNMFYKLGNPYSYSSPVPITVTGVVSAASLTSEGSHNCVIDNTGGIKCWGYNGNGQLGNGTTANAASPVSVIGF